MVFVGIELDEVGQLGLLTWNVGRQAVDEWTPELAHGACVLGVVECSRSLKWYHADSMD